VTQGRKNSKHLGKGGEGVQSRWKGKLLQKHTQEGLHTTLRLGMEGSEGKGLWSDI
jgi:hypothetical protein